MDLTANRSNATTAYPPFGTAAESGEHTVLAVACFLLAVLILFTNGLTIVAFYRFPELCTQTNVFVWHLAVADSLVGLSACLMGFLFTDFAGPAFHGSVHLCLFHYTLIMISCTQSLGTLLRMAVDRLVYVVYPFTHARCFTERKTKLYMGLAWLVSIALGTMRAFYNVFSPETGCSLYTVGSKNLDRFAMSICISVHVIITSTCYARIACVAYKQRKAISAHMRLAQRVQKQEDLPNGTQRTSHVVNGEQSSITKRLRHAKPIGPVGLFVTVNCLFAVCWIPWTVQNFLLGVLDNSVDTTLAEWLFLLAMSNSAMNAVILASKNKHFARAYRTLLLQHNCCRKNDC